MFMIEGYHSLHSLAISWETSAACICGAANIIPRLKIFSRFDNYQKYDNE